MQKQNGYQPGKAAVGYTHPGEGPQGVDKAPGEETSTSTDNTVRNAQRGVGKEDGDPTQPSDQPISNP